jgi:hypothetical protein
MRALKSIKSKTSSNKKKWEPKQYKKTQLIFGRSNMKPNVRREKTKKRRRKIVCQNHAIGLLLTHVSPPERAWCTAPNATMKVGFWLPIVASGAV